MDDLTQRVKKKTLFKHGCVFTLMYVHVYVHIANDMYDCVNADSFLGLQATPNGFRIEFWYLSFTSAPIAPKVYHGEIFNVW